MGISVHQKMIYTFESGMALITDKPLTSDEEWELYYIHGIIKDIKRVE